MIIALAGYMGSGKSHIAALLSEASGRPLIDLDKEIVRRSGMPIPEIFREKGELFFRKKERECLEEILAGTESAILSLGGGTPAYYNNMDVINSRSLSIFLRTSVPVLAARLLRQKHKRPMLANISDEDLPEFIAKHLFDRNAYYAKCRYFVDTDGKTPAEITAEIMALPEL